MPGPCGGGHGRQHGTQVREDTPLLSLETYERDKCESFVRIIGLAKEKVEKSTTREGGGRGAKKTVMFKVREGLE